MPFANVFNKGCVPAQLGAREAYAALSARKNSHPEGAQAAHTMWGASGSISGGLNMSAEVKICKSSSPLRYLSPENNAMTSQRSRFHSPPGTEAGVVN